jgi:elongation factor 2
MIPIGGERLAAYGRIFSGTIKSGEKVRIMGTNYKIGNKNELYEKNVGQVGIFLLGNNPEYLPDVPCGSTLTITGIDDYILKTGTITSIAQ